MVFFIMVWTVGNKKRSLKNASVPAKKRKNPHVAECVLWGLIGPILCCGYFAAVLKGLFLGIIWAVPRVSVSFGYYFPDYFHRESF